MATNSLQLNQSNPVAGLGTSTYNVLTAGVYFVEVKSTIPLASALQIVINQNGSPIVTSGGTATDPTPTQESIGAACSIQCAAADVITVVLSSANAVDGLPNAVKSIVNLYQGV